MNKHQLATMSVEDLWELHGLITKLLAEKITADKKQLDAKFNLLQSKRSANIKGRTKKRSYPEVRQKYRNPVDPSQTWSGRGKQPAWVKRLLQAGTKLEQLVIEEETLEHSAA